MKYFVQVNGNNELVKLHLDFHKLDGLLLSEIELMGLYVLIVSEGNLDYLINHFFTKERLDKFIRLRILTKIQNGNIEFYKMKNKYYKNEIIKHYAILLNFKNPIEAETWAIQNGYLEDKENSFEVNID